jgi:hypothetical protein
MFITIEADDLWVQLSRQREPLSTLDGEIVMNVKPVGGDDSIIAVTLTIAEAHNMRDALKTLIGYIE